jgi:hypothetical protein
LCVCRIPRRFDAEEAGVGEERQRGLEIGIAIAHEEDLPRPIRRHDGPSPIVGGELIRRRGRVGGGLPGDQAYLDDADAQLDVVDDDVGSLLGAHPDVPCLEEEPVAPYLEPPHRRFHVKVGHAHEDRSGDSRWRRPDGEGDDRLVAAPALTADAEHPDPGIDGGRWDRSQRGVGCDQHLCVT